MLKGEVMMKSLKWVLSLAVGSAPVVGLGLPASSPVIDLGPVPQANWFVLGTAQLSTQGGWSNASSKQYGTGSGGGSGSMNFQIANNTVSSLYVYIAQSPLQAGSPFPSSSSKICQVSANGQPITYGTNCAQGATYTPSFNNNFYVYVSSNSLAGTNFNDYQMVSVCQNSQQSQYHLSYKASYVQNFSGATLTLTPTSCVLSSS